MYIPIKITLKPSSDLLRLIGKVIRYVHELKLARLRCKFLNESQHRKAYSGNLLEGFHSEAEFHVVERVFQKEYFYHAKMIGGGDEAWYICISVSESLIVPQLMMEEQWRSYCKPFSRPLRKEASLMSRFRSDF